MNAHQIIIRPLITEKNTNLMSLNKYSFEVDKTASKPQIGAAISEIFNVRVTNVTTMNVRGKLRRRGLCVLNVVSPLSIPNSTASYTTRRPLPSRPPAL